MKTQGFIALMTILIISGILILMSIYFSQSEVLVSGLYLKEKGSSQALANAEACAETALDKFLASPSYNGNETITLDNGSCQILALEHQGDTKIFKTTGTFGDFTKRIKVEFKRTGQKIELFSWQEVADF